jgi:hypothetical protein
MGHFGSIVGVLVLAKDNGRHHLAFRCGIAPEFVRSHFDWNAFLAFQQLPEEALGGALVLAALDEDIQDLTILVDGTPKILAFALNRHRNLIEEPTLAKRPSLLAEASRVVKPKPGTPQP